MPEHLTLGWEPKRTWVFAVGTLEWKRADYFSPFPKKNRRDEALVEFFRAQGVPEAQIVYLQDSQATTRRIQQAFETQLAQVGADDLLVLYYCGHGGKNDDASAYFASYDTDCDSNLGWVVTSIPKTIVRHFNGARALLMVDCCYSGSLADALAKQRDHGAYACLTSSLASESSTGNWTFTEGLLAGLLGQTFVDADGNSQISLQELATQMIDSMAFAEEQIATFAVGGGFDANMIVAAARTRPNPQVGLRVEVLDEGKWYPAQIIDADGARRLVHYYGYEQSDDAWVTSERIRQVTRPTYPAGTAVEVQWKNKWYPAKVLDSHSGIHQIQYDDYGPEWNEWVSLKRIRAAEGVKERVSRWQGDKVTR